MARYQQAGHAHTLCPESGRFSHGPEVIEKLLTRWWKYVLLGVEWLVRLFPWARGMHTNFYDNVGDLNDDIRDAWSSEVNSEQADQMLGELFAAQNDTNSDVSVVILSGDIHTSGYATVFSTDHAHRHHVVDDATGRIKYIIEDRARRSRMKRGGDDR